MVLLHAVAHAREHAQRLDGDGVRRDEGAVAVATFDHRSGPHAAHAVEHVRRWGAGWGFPVVVGRAPSSLAGADEAEWRRARWRFLHDLESGGRAVLVTAHTRDDHLETIVMRTMRGSGGRGLSALLAPSRVRRPFLGITRAEILAYARELGVPWHEDPGNASRAHLRNRVRLDLLPALRRASPTIEAELLALAERAATLRRECAEVVRPLIVESGPGRVVARGVTDDSWSLDARALLWQSIAEVAGIALDWRGTERLARFSATGRGGTRIPLSGGYEAVHRHETIELRRRPVPVAGTAPLGVASETIFGSWRFRAVAATSLTEAAGGQPDVGSGEGESVSVRDPWRAWLPLDATLQVRAWQAGDRMRSSGSQARRVKRYLADRRVAAVDREGWPVVMADGEIVWIPGVRRGHAASVRSGRPGVCIVCERVSH